MTIVRENNFSIYFGSSSDQLFPDYYLNLAGPEPLLARTPFRALRNQLPIEHLFFAEQVHGVKGKIITHNDLHTWQSFAHEGDFLITNLRYVALGIMSADCLPIILIDHALQLVAIIHAGWRGTVNAIVGTVLAQLKELGSNPGTLTAYLGPAAGSCCYQVDESFVQAIESNPHAQESLFKKNRHLYFDLAKANILQLQAAGIPSSSIITTYNLCTICNPDFFSYRRQGKTAGRQMSVVCLV
jgi:YfiH family protein